MGERSEKAPIRHQLRGALRGGWYPVRLPHVKIVDDGVSILDGDPVRVSPQLVAALRLCDGTRTLADVAAAIGADRAQIIEDRNRVMLWREPVRQEPVKLNGPAKYVVISPHLDDAALSVGALVLQRPRVTTLVINAFSTVSWWRFEIQDLAPIQMARDAEDDLVMRLLGAEVRYWQYGEAPLRGYPLKEIFTTPRLPESDRVHEELIERIKSLADEQPAAQWLLPLGVGNHVDHRILRDAAIDGLRHGGVSASRVTFYEDLPYTAKVGGLPDFSEFLNESWPGAKLEIAGYSKRSAHASKLTLLRAYYTQLADGHFGLIDEYARRVGGWRRRERTWRLRGDKLPKNGTRKP